jgi:hypothetical protein
MVCCAICAAACRKSPPGATGRQTGDAGADASFVAPPVRDAVLESAQVWKPPAVPVSRASLAANPEDSRGFAEDSEVFCRFLLQKVGGATPKFNCQLPDGDVIKVKYGTGNAELFAEVAASRLLSTLGFAADRMYIVRKVRCAGCPPVPFPVLRCLSETGLEQACLPGGIRKDHSVDFEPAVIERRLEGRIVESYEDQGWAWYELDRVSPRAGGAPRAHVDALRLLAVVLAHWDNKAENQRLVCPPGADRADGGCSSALAIIQDLGATFGPFKLDLPNWRSTPVWTDPVDCRVSMAHLPFGGATFTPRQISEEGRQLLLQLLEQLTADQIEQLFTHARVAAFDGISAEGRNASAWVAAFQSKVAQIRRAGACPPASSLTGAPAR